MAERTPRIAAALCLVVFLAGALHWYRPFLTQKRDVIDSTPSLAGVLQRDVVTLAPKQTVCVQPVAIRPTTSKVRVIVTTFGQPAQPLGVDVQGEPGPPRYYTFSERASYPVGGDQLVDVPIKPPDKAVSGFICVSNRGHAKIGLIGTSEPRSQSPARTQMPTPDGARETADIALTLLHDKRQSLGSRLGDAIAHASAFGGGYLPRWLLWLVAVLLAAGTPLALAGALLASRR